MTHAPFVNLDAQFLFDLAQTDEVADWDETCVRLMTIATRLEALDERLRNLTSAPEGKTYADGVRDERQRIFGRTNLPLQSVEVSTELRAAMLAAPARRVEKPKPKPLPNKAPKNPRLEEVLRGLKIDISKIGG